jgi:glycosyltransferase involved in cell wall biosynthesis
MTGDATVQREATPRVTLVVTPRERFGVARESLESIYAQSDIPFDLVYVDGKSPADLSRWIADQARARGFRHIVEDRYLSPNGARNIGLRAAATDYVVFIDNDVVCSPGWLSRLVATADESGADVVAPLTCQGLPAHNQIHQAGAIFTHDLEAFLATPPGKRIMIEEMHLQGEPVSAAPAGPVETQCCEFHCVLVRRNVFDRIGPLDEEMLATKEHVDFCLSVLASGGKVLLEPRSVVTYLFPNRARPLTSEDMPYFLVRWSDAWQRRSIDRLQQKWGLEPDQPYLAERLRHTRWRYEEGLVKPIVKKVPFTKDSRFVWRVVRKAVSTVVYARGDLLTRKAISAETR